MLGSCDSLPAPEHSRILVETNFCFSGGYIVRVRWSWELLAKRIANCRNCWGIMHLCGVLLGLLQTLVTILRIIFIIFIYIRATAISQQDSAQNRNCGATDQLPHIGRYRGAKSKGGMRRPVGNCSLSVNSYIDSGRYIQSSSYPSQGYRYTIWNL